MHGPEFLTHLKGLRLNYLTVAEDNIMPLPIAVIEGEGDFKVLSWSASRSAGTSHESSMRAPRVSERW